MPRSTDRWVIVLNFNGRDDTLQLLSDLGDSADFRVLVVDNGSEDGLVAELTRNPRWSHVRVLQTGSNLGYAGGNNAGLDLAQGAGAHAICVLNNDTRTSAAALTALFEACLVDSRVAVSPEIRYASDPDVAWFKGARFDLGSGRPVHLQPGEQPRTEAVFETPFLTGCAIAASAEIWRSVGGFDASYFLIFEDMEWSLRARRAGVRLLVDPSITLQHRVSRSFTGPHAALAAYYFSRNGLRFAAASGEPGARLRFLVHEVLRPAARDVGGGRRSSAHLRLLGCWAALRGHRGEAPPPVVEIALRQSPS